MLGASGRAPAVAVLGGCAIVVVVLGLLLRGQTRAGAFDNAVDSPFISFFAGHKNLLLWLAVPGTLIPAVVISAAIAAWCLVAGRLNGSVLALAAVPVSTELDDGVLKHFFDRTYLGALSYPSGHTTAVVALTATLAVLLLVPPRERGTRPARVLLIGACCVISLVVVVAVIALRWHYFTDTVAGAAVGVGTVCALALILDLAWRQAPVRSHTNSEVASAARHQDGHLP